MVFVDELDYLLSDTEMNYTEARKEIKVKVKQIKEVERKVRRNLMFSNYELNADAVFDRLKNLELELRSSSLSISEKTVMVNGREKKEYVINERGSSVKNSEEEKMVRFLSYKDKVYQDLSLFVKCFKNLEEQEREVIFYTYFKGMKNEKLSIELCCSIAKICRVKKEATLKLVEELNYNDWKEADY